MIIIVLGFGSHQKEKLSRETEERLEEGIRQQKKRNAFILPCGKSENESKLMHNYLVSSKVEKILPGEDSANTALAAYFAKTKYFLPQKEGRAFVITSSYQLERVEYIFRKVFGEDYKIHFTGLTTNLCCGSRNIIMQKQRELTQRAVELLYGIREGDHEKVKERVLEK